MVLFWMSVVRSDVPNTPNWIAILLSWNWLPETTKPWVDEFVASLTPMIAVLFVLTRMPFEKLLVNVLLLIEPSVSTAVFCRSMRTPLPPAGLEESRSDRTCRS